MEIPLPTAQSATSSARPKIAARLLASVLSFGLLAAMLISWGTINAMFPPALALFLIASAVPLVANRDEGSAARRAATFPYLPKLLGGTGAGTAPSLR